MMGTSLRSGCENLALSEVHSFQVFEKEKRNTRILEYTELKYRRARRKFLSRHITVYTVRFVLLLNSDVSDLYSGGAQFESQPGHQTYVSWLLSVFPVEFLDSILNQVTTGSKLVFTFHPITRCCINMRYLQRRYVTTDTSVYLWYLCEKYIR
jgi:hypothetical protein